MMMDIGGQPYIVRCQLDAYLKTLGGATVLEAVKATEEEKLGGLNAWRIRLSDTILFPEGGGQPSDLGEICLEDSPENVRPVSSVKRFDDGSVWHYVDQEIPKGSTVQMNVDWTRRFDHMQQHSGQHLLSAVAEKHMSLPTVGWSLSKIDEACYVDLQGPKLTKSHLKELESLVNDYIVQNLGFQAKIYSFSEVQETEAKTRAEIDSKFPVRVMDIQGLDSNMCCGTHIKSTGELQVCKVYKSDVCKKDKTTGTVVNRVHFRFGQRVLTHLDSLYDTSRQLTDALSISSSEHLSRVKALLDDQRKTGKKTKTILTDLAGYVARSLVLEFTDQKQGKVLFHHYREGTADYLALLLKHLLSALKAQLIDATLVTIFLVVGDETRKGSGSFLLQAPEKMIADLKEKALQILGAKGGGKGIKVQGRIPAGSLTVKALKEVEEALHHTEVNPE